MRKRINGKIFNIEYKLEAEDGQLTDEGKKKKIQLQSGQTKG